MQNHSYVKLFYHFVWATKNRRPFLNKDIRLCLYNYLGKMCCDINLNLLAIGGIEDHVHILVQSTANIHIPNAVRFLKSNSSRLVKENFISEFAWQGGYSVFTVDQTSLPRIKNYIKTQEEHHKPFDSEFEGKKLCP